MSFWAGRCTLLKSHKLLPSPTDGSRAISPCLPSPKYTPESSRPTVGHLAVCRLKYTRVGMLRLICLCAHAARPVGYINWTSLFLPLSPQPPHFHLFALPPTLSSLSQSISPSTPHLSPCVSKPLSLALSWLLLLRHPWSPPRQIPAFLWLASPALAMSCKATACAMAPTTILPIQTIPRA